MATYKIKNITNELGIRDVNYNKTLDIEYLDNFTRKVYKLKPNQIMFLETKKLELSVEKLRAKGYIIVDHVKSRQTQRTIKVEGGGEVVEKPTKKERPTPRQTTRKNKPKPNPIVEIKEEDKTETTKE